MSREERYIRSKCGSGNPFRVPDGYFDRFATGFMENLPEREPVAIPRKKTPLIRIWGAVAAAACVMAAVISTAVFFNNGTADGSQNMAQDTAYTIEQMNHDEYIDVVADYAMMDNADIYACLAEE